MTDPAGLHSDTGLGETAEGPTTMPRAAVDRERRLVTFVQPFYNLQTDRLQGFEALARLQSDARDEQTPAEFFAAAVDAGQMYDIDLRILDDALAHIARWRENASHRDLILSVNLSPEFLGRRHVVQDITDALRRHRVPGNRLLVDITTPTFRRLQQGGGDGLEGLRDLRHSEVSFCLDGFTASDTDLLSAATTASVDIVKLHPGEVAAAGTSEGRSRLSEVSDAVGEAGLPLVAAGVEAADQLRLLRELGVEWAQGFFLGQPVAAEDTVPDVPLRLPS